MEHSDTCWCGGKLVRVTWGFGVARQCQDCQGVISRSGKYHPPNNGWENKRGEMLPLAKDTTEE